MSDGEAIASLGEVANEPIAQSGPPAEGTFIYVDIGSVDKESKTIGETKEMPVSDAPSRAKQLLREGDVLVSMTRPNLNAVAIVPPQLDGAIGSTGFHVLRTRWMEPEFLHYLVQTSEFVEAMVSVVQGALYPAIRPTDIKNFQFRLPPRAEQTRIVEKLEALLANLDAGVAELKAAQRKLVQYRQSLLKAAMDGALTAGWRAAHTPEGRSSTAEGWSSGERLLQRILQERRARFVQKHGGKKKYPEPVAPDVSQLPELPDGWVWATIDQLSFVVRGASPRPAGDPRFFGGDIPWITVGSLTADEAMYLESVEQFVTPAGRDASRYIEPNTLLLTNSGATLGVPKITRIGGCINDGSVALLDVEQPMQTYLYWFLRTQTKRLRAMNQGAAQPNLNTDIVRNICVPLCGSEEMRHINAALEKSVDAINGQQSAIAHGLKLAADQRRNLLRAAFAGQLVPQDPNDEPASALLERIRAEKAGNAGERGTKKNGKRTNSPA